jgi:hypothetical protein
MGMSKINILCAYDELSPIEDLKPNPKNRNLHPPEQVEKLAQLIKAYERLLRLRLDLDM